MILQARVVIMHTKNTNGEFRSIKMNSLPRRINVYGNDGDCMDDRDLRPFCYCKYDKLLPEELEPLWNISNPYSLYT